MINEVPYDLDAICDACGHTGAYDFYGDFLCDNCILIDEHDNSEIPFDD